MFVLRIRKGKWTVGGEGVSSVPKEDFDGDEVEVEDEDDDIIYDDVDEDNDY